MRFVYFSSIAGTLDSGVSKKIQQQVSELIKLNIDAQIILICGSKVPTTINSYVKFYKSKYLDNSNILNKIRRQFLKRMILNELISFLGENDIVYLRSFDPMFYFVSPNRNKLCKIVSEHNSIEHLEYKSTGNYLNLFLELALGKYALNHIDAIVGVTDEITEFELSRADDSNKPHITIGNGIDVSSFKLRNPISFSGDELQLICVASISRWHALDRLLNGLALYRGYAKVKLHIVGDGKELKNLQAIAKNHGFDDKVSFHGFMSGNALDKLFDSCHIAIGSLGIHRKGLRMTSELKIREYTARGIPFICGTIDPDFPYDFPYVHKVPSDESPIDIEDIISFVKSVYLDSDHHIKMRIFAENNLDWSIKMERLKEFCEALISE